MKTFLVSVEYRQALILERFEQRARARITARGERVDCVGGVAERVGREAYERVFVCPGIGDCRRDEQKSDGKYERHDAIVEATHVIPPRQTT